MANLKSINVRGASLTDQGLARKENQDAFFVDQQKGLFIVADGMGGHAAGATASRRVIELLPGLVAEQYGRLGQNGKPVSDAEIGQALRKAAIKLNAQIHLEGEADINKRGMGATVVVASFVDNWVYLMHLGDSRAYLWRRSYFQQLTEDHTVGMMLLRLNQITPEELEQKPVLQRLSRCVGMEGEAKPEVQKMVVQGGDRILLCSDGLTKMVGDERVSEILGESDEPETICERLVAAANAAGGLDNVTAVVIFVEGVAAA
ncbi:MAG: protein phosphatase 2C domain-containing protein [Candidatus Promineifilaceae bacterium]